MGGRSSSRPGSRRRRTRPAVEGLEGRVVMSHAGGAASAVADSTPLLGILSNNSQTFQYTTPQGTHVKLQIVGRGSLEGTKVDPNGALQLLYSKTNAFTKIMSDVHGGTGQADLASVFNRDQSTNQGANAISGVGSTLIGTINLPDFNLIPGGTINATAGINILGLNSVGPNTQIQLRDIPPNVTAGTTTQTTSAGVQNNYVTGVFSVQTLAGSDSEFLSAGNLILPTANGNPGPPPAPPGIVIKINHIKGVLATPGGLPVNLLGDARIFGYDPSDHSVHRFALNLATGVGVPDTGFAPIAVPGAPPTASLSVGRDGTAPQSPQVLLVAAGTSVYVYNATTGAPMGSFTMPQDPAAPPGQLLNATSLGSTDTLTVLGETPAGVTNPPVAQLQMIDVAASLAAGTATSTADNPAPYTPPPGFSLQPGLTGLPGSNRIYSLVAARFNTFQPDQPVLGLSTVETSLAVPNLTGGEHLIHQFSTVSQKAFTTAGAYLPIPNPANPQLGSSMGSVDRDLAVNTLGTSGTTPNTLALYGQTSLTRRGTIRLQDGLGNPYPTPLTDLSETFRPDLVGTALVDVQGNIQSFRGLDANGLVLNDTGNLNLLKTGRITNSTILGQPVGHIQAPINHRSNVLIISSATVTAKRHPDIRVVPGLQQVGPLSQPFDVPGSVG